MWKNLAFKWSEGRIISHSLNCIQEPNSLNLMSLTHLELLGQISYAFHYDVHLYSLVAKILKKNQLYWISSPLTQVLGFLLIITLYFNFTFYWLWEYLVIRKFNITMKKKIFYSLLIVIFKFNYGPIWRSWLRLPIPTENIS